MEKKKGKTVVLKTKEKPTLDSIFQYPSLSYFGICVKRLFIAFVFRLFLRVDHFLFVFLSKCVHCYPGKIGEGESY